MAKCDIVVGKILPEVGWFGKFELEGMALGKPVIAYVSDERINTISHQFTEPKRRHSRRTYKPLFQTLLSVKDYHQRV